MANVTETVIAQSADLRLSISPVTPSPGLTSLPYSYVVTVTNAGPQDATNVVVKDLVGDGAVLFGVDTTGTISELSPTLDNISFGKLAVGASETLTFSDGAVQAGTFTDTVSVSADQVDPNLANNMANVTETVIAQSADLRLSISPVTPSPGLTSLPYSYVVTVINAGPQDATNVVVKDLVGNGPVLFGVDTTGAITEISPTLDNISFGKLAVGASQTLTFSDLAVQTGTFTDTVSVSADQADPNLANNMANVTETVIAQSADLRLSISRVTPSPGLTSLPYSYVVTVINAGPQDATNVVVKDLVGNGALLFGVDTTGAISELSPTLDNISFAKLAAGASVTLTFADRAAQPGTVTDTVSVSADQADPNLANNMANVTETVIAQSADLKLSIGAVTPSPGLTSLPYRYSVTVTNAGPQDATNVLVKDLVGNGAVLYEVDTTGAISEISPTQDNISFGKLAAGASVTLTFADRAAQPGTFIDTVSVLADQADPNLANNMANVTETVIAQSAAPINVFVSLRDTGNGTFAPFLTWGIPLGSTDPSTFVIYRSTVPGGEGTVAYASTSGAHDFIGSVGRRGTTYYFEVAEFVGGVEGSRSKEASVTIPGIVNKTSRGRVPAGPAKRRSKLHAGAGLKQAKSTAPLHPSKSQKAHGPSVLRLGQRGSTERFQDTPMTSAHSPGAGPDPGCSSLILPRLRPWPDAWWQWPSRASGPRRPAQDRVAGRSTSVEGREVADHAEHLRAVEQVGLVDGRLAGRGPVAGSVEARGVVELGHVDDVSELAQLLDVPQSLLALEPGLEGHAEPQCAGEEDQEVEPGGDRPEELADRAAELPPRVEMPGEIPEPHEGQADRQGGDCPDGQDGPGACRPRVRVATATLVSSSASPARLLPGSRVLMSSARFFAVSTILLASSRCFGSGPDRGRNSNASNTSGMLRYFDEIEVRPVLRSDVAGRRRLPRTTAQLPRRPFPASSETGT